MLGVCPRGQEGNVFIHEFLSRLPKDIRLMLSRKDFDDQRALADRADELWTQADTARQHHDVVAAIAEDDLAMHIAAVRGQSRQYALEFILLNAQESQ
jgi:hypothetical protein